MLVDNRLVGNNKTYNNNPDGGRRAFAKQWRDAAVKFLCCIWLALCPALGLATPEQRQTIKALYIPLADHYAAIVAYERYREQMQFADFQIEQMGNWDLLRAYFQSGEADMAYVMTPLALAMYQQQADFRWIGLMHRDGNALAINDLIKQQVELPVLRQERKPSADLAEVFKRLHVERKEPTVVGVPHLFSTHTVVLYRYLQEHGAVMGLNLNDSVDVLPVAVPPPQAPAFIKGKSNRAQPAAFEQSLPWADVVETGGFGHVAWYSKDVMPWPDGHVECIALATDRAIADKFAALQEVMSYIQRAGRDIERARDSGGETMQAIVDIITQHIPAHNQQAIEASLDANLRVINYQKLNIDKAGLQQIMGYAIDAGLLAREVDIDAFADTRFDVPESNNN
ncbi:nitrate ABC transporter substrate-binding protein [Gammaproteobacteria bacterium 53_120_T64]|nr:nitrate ABC transporter substrate-binding protein [Gammaproteobacteria bacterium 53_120_T64]